MSNVAEYNATPRVLLDHGKTPLQTDANGYLKTTAAGSSNVSSASGTPTRFGNLAANATLNVKASPGNVFSATCSNSNAAARYLQLHDTATVPANAAVPFYSFLVPAASQIVIGTDFFTTSGARFATGIAFAFSTTRDTYTAGTNTDQQTVIHYA